MATVILGIGSSHSPLLSTPHEAFAGLADLDRARLPGFESMARRNAARVAHELREDVTRARHEATRAAIGQLAAVLATEAPDALVVIGDDQGEWLSADSQPARCIYRGDWVESLPPPRESLPLRRLSYWGYYGDGTNRAFPVDAALGRHLVETLTREHDFVQALEGDIGSSGRPAAEWRPARTLQEAIANPVKGQSLPRRG